VQTEMYTATSSATVASLHTGNIIYMYYM